MYLKRLAYDLDWSLHGGRPVADDDAAEWIRYRDAILARGTQLRPDPDGAQLVPLPALSPGPHRLCLASERSNGSRSNEAECLGVVIPERR